MERHGDASHVYSLPSSRHRATSRPNPPLTIPPQGPAISPVATARPSLDATRSAGDSPKNSFSPSTYTQGRPSDDTTRAPSLFPPVSARKYDCQNWTLVSLKRSSTAPRSAPTSPFSPNPPSAPSSASSYLIATLLHIPTESLYAWPIALQGSSSGKCFVTQSPTPPPGAERYEASAVLSESIKVLSDVIQAWIKTGPMRESLRRRESKREKGIRKIGENQQDAIWLNDGLGLKSLDEAARYNALERAWKDEGESVESSLTGTGASPSAHPRTSPSSSDLTRSPNGPAAWPSPQAPARPLSTSPRQAHKTAFALPPPKQSLDSLYPSGPASNRGQGLAPSGSNTAPTSPESSIEPYSRPATPRIEISEAKESPQLPSSPPPPRLDTPVEHAVTKVDRQQEAIDAEISQWMNTASLADFTRPRNVSQTSAMSPHASRPNSPASKARKSVTFSQPPVSSPAAPSARLAYRPPFAPHVEFAPGEEDEEEFSGLWMPHPPTASKPTSLPLETTPSTAHFPSARASEDTPRKSNSPTASSKSSSELHPQHALGPSSQQPPGSRTRFASISTVTAGPSAQIASGEQLRPILSSPTAALGSSRHRRSTSKLSQEIPADQLAGLAPSSSPSGDKKGRLSPVQSLADIKSALKAFKPSKKKVGAV